MEEALDYSKKALNEKANYENYYVVACMLAINGKTEEAFETLEIALKLDCDYDWMMKDKDLVSIRAQEERWKKLVEKYCSTQIKEK